jgi:hypothetical protein
MRGLCGRKGVCRCGACPMSARVLPFLSGGPLQSFNDRRILIPSAMLPTAHKHECGSYISQIGACQAVREKEDWIWNSKQDVLLLYGVFCVHRSDSYQWWGIHMPDLRTYDLYKLQTASTHGWLSRRQCYATAIGDRTRKWMAALLFMLANGGIKLWLQSYDVCVPVFSFNILMSDKK